MSNRTSKLFSMFVGPKGENLDLLSSLIVYGLGRHKKWRARFFQDDPSLYPPGQTLFTEDEKEIHHAFDELLDRLESNIPFFHPRYAAQMLKDPAIPAALGYIMTMLINPNNHAYEGGPATTEMELEVIDDLLRLVGFDSGWGHLTSGGSLANLEALWAVRDLRKKGQVLFSVGSHLSWMRICNILNIPGFKEIPVDKHYRMDLNALESELKRGETMMVMANFGTTGCGAVDPIEDILKLREKYGFHLHVDAAYGGYVKALMYDADFQLLSFKNAGNALTHYVYQQGLALADVDSVTIDPHKHGMMPYGAGSVLFRHENLRQAILNSAPYTYHVKEKPNIGTYTLECSRPGAAAAGTWLTHKLFPLHREGIGMVLEKTLGTAQAAHGAMNQLDNLHPLTEPDLDILCFYSSPGNQQQKKISTVNKRTSDIYQNLSIENPKAPFILSKFVIDEKSARTVLPNTEMDEDSFITMRAVFMKHWMLMDSENPYFERFVQQLEKVDSLVLQKKD